MRKVDGFELEFTHRGSWKARRFAKGVLLDTIPVAWERDYKHKTKALKIYLRRHDELQDYRSRQEPFIVAVAKAKDYNVFPHAIDFFTCIYRVEFTGEILEENAIQTRVLERLRAS